MIVIKNILVPTDFSETSRVALTYARELAERFQSAVHLLHIIPEVNLGLEAMDVPNVLPEDRQEQWANAAEDQLRNLLPDAERARLRVRREVRRGHPFVEIVRYAKRRNIDVIVMGTHGRGAIEHMLLGSVAENVVRQATCPVLTVRDPEHEFTKP